MDTALPQKLQFILDRNLAKANCTENQVCTSCDIVVVDSLAPTYSPNHLTACSCIYYKFLEPSRNL